MQRVAAAFQQSPQRSVRRHSVALGLMPRTVRRFLHAQLKFHPFKIQIVQEILPRDLDVRIDFCRDILRIIEETPQFLSQIIMSDEAHFHLNGYKQNCSYWAPNNPCMLHQKPLHGAKVTVWCAISAFEVFGPYFFEDPIGQTVTVTSQRYVVLLQVSSRRTSSTTCSYATDVVPAGRGYCPHSKGVHESRARNVPATCPVSLWGHCLASTLNRFIGIQCLSMGLFEGEGVRSSPSHYSGIEGLHQRENSQYSTGCTAESH